MVFAPTLEIGILNGWLFFVAYLVVFGITMFSFSPAVRARLYDRSLWTRRQRIVTIIGKLFALSIIFLFIFTPLRLEQPWFIVGLILWVVGLAGLVTALLNYNNTPLNQPVTAGIYKYSRNPQILTIWILFGGICFMIGSGLSLLLLAISIAFAHSSVLAEEASCLEQYGDDYRDFMNQVPRYFLIL